MASKNYNEISPLREEWPRIRAVTVKGVDYFQVDGRPTFKRKAFTTVDAARKQANKWENTRARYGTAGKFISEKDATRFAEALDVLAPHGASIMDAARHYAAHLEAEKHRASSKPVSDALAEWVASYGGKDRDAGTKVELASKARIFGRAFGALKLSDLKAALLIKWIEGYEVQPGKPASPQTRQNLKTKTSQFLSFAKLKGWIENNPLQGIKIKRPPRAPVEIFDVKQVKRIIEAADKSAHRDILLPYVVICFFAGLRPTEAEKLKWNDIHFATGDIHVRGETSKTREERFVPMEVNLIAWLETCPVRHPGPITGTSRRHLRKAWVEVKRATG